MVNKNEILNNTHILVEDTNFEGPENNTPDKEERDWGKDSEEMEIQQDEYSEEDEEDDDYELSEEEIEFNKEFSPLYSDDEGEDDFYYDTKNESQRREVGKCLAKRIAKILEDLGFEIQLAHGQSNGIDIKIGFNNKLVAVIEVKNYNIRTKITKKLIKQALANFKKYPNCDKFVVYSCMANEEALSRFTAEGIMLIRLDYQVLPEIFYNSLGLPVRSHRKIDNESTSLDIKGKIYPIIHIILATYRDEVLLTVSV